MAKKFSLKIINLVAVLAIVLAGIFGLSACSNWPWGEDTPSSDSRYDSLGRLRISSVGVNYNSVPKNGDVNDKTGSFDWDLAYYFDVGKDYTYSNGTHYYGELDSGNIVISTGSDYVYRRVGEEYDYYNGSSTIKYTVDRDGYYTISYSDGKVVATYHETSTQAYIQQMIGDVPDGTPLSNTLLYKSNVIKNYDAQYNRPVFVYSSYIISVSGINYLIKVEVKNADNLVIDYSNKSQLFSFANGANFENTFKVSYKVAGTSWTEVSSSTYNMIQLEQAEDGRFIMRYYPKLDKGASTRYVQVKASTTEALENESAGDRATSALSGITAFKVYMLTFDINVFSSTKSYRGLTYDKTKYYFTSDNQSAANSTLIGYFPEGRVVKVSRSIEKAGDYAFQSWTSGSEANNSYVLANYMPNDHHDYPLQYTGANDPMYSCLSDLQKRKGSYEVSIGNSTPNINTNYAQEQIVSTSAGYTGTISVVSSSNTASHVFHANLAKVRNLVAAGSFVDAEKLTEEGSLANAKLDGVIMYVYQKRVNETDLLIGTLMDDAGHLVFQAADSSIEHHFEGYYTDGNFSIEGFYWDYYLMFELMSPETGNYYTFYSDSTTMIRLDETNQNSIRILQFARPSNYSSINDIVTDTVQNTIMATSEPATEKVNVNLFVYRNGSVEDLNPNGTQIPYQVISTTTSEADELGYTTSKIIISLQLPSNYTLTSYTIETLNSIGQILYTNVDATEEDKYVSYILCDVSYNKETQSQLNRYYYVTTKAIDKSQITTNASQSYIYYGEEGQEKQLYQFSKRDSEVIGEQTISNYYYDLMSENEVLKTIKRSIPAEGNATYTLYEYSPITVGKLDADGNPDGSADAYLEKVDQGDDPTVITVDYLINYEGTKYEYADMTSSDISIVAEAYKVNNLTYTPLDSNGDPVTDASGNPIVHDVYVYYDVKAYTYKAGGNIYNNYYYTAPIGKRINKIQESDGNIRISNPEPEIYFDAFKSFRTWNENEQKWEEGQLANMIGSRILENQSNYSEFINAIGGTAAIIADCYYYTEKLGDPTKLLISQYINSDADEKTQTVDMLYEFVEDPETHEKTPTTVYNGDAYRVLDNYTYKLSGRFFFPKESDNGGELANTTIEYDAEHNKYIYVDINNNRVEYDLSTSNDYFYLYTPLTVQNGIFDSTVAISKKPTGYNPNYISANIESATQIDGDSYYFDQRVSHDVGVSDATRIAMVYQFFIYADNVVSVQYHDEILKILEGDVISVDIFYDGTNFYYDSRKTTVIKDENSDMRRTFPVINKLNANGDSFEYELKLNDYYSLFIPVVEKDGSNWKAVHNTNNARFVDNSSSTEQIVNTTFHTYCNTRYFDFAETSASETDPTKLGNEYYVALGNAEGNNFVDKIILSGSISMTSTEHYSYKKIDDNSDLLRVTATMHITQPKNAVVRKAILDSNRSVDVHLVGKLVLITGDVIQYPVYDAQLETSYKDILGDKSTYYEIDYTTKNSVIQAFPGVTLISGAPYVNPILYYELVHKTGEKTELNVGLEIVDAYYVELISNAITSTEINLIYDFATVSFKDTITNLTQNDYIDRMYYVVFAKDLGTVVGYTLRKDDAGNEIMVPYLGGTPLTIQNIGLNDNDKNVYVAGDITESGRYITPLYYEVANADDADKTIDGRYYKLLSSEELVIWSSSATELENVPTFDIHSYNIADNGMIVLSSDGKENEVCEKVDNLYINGTGSTATSYDYNEVLIGGTTSAYRVDASIFTAEFKALQAFTWGSAINIANTYDATKAYFLCGKEGVVLVANPIVSIPNDGEEIIYRFKRWVVYSRYNSEVLYLNNELINSHADVYNAVMRFTANEAGYFVFMPVYERVYSINLATAIQDGAENLGGSINILYEVNPFTGNGAAINLNNSNYDNAAEDETGDDGKEAINIYFVEYLKTELAGKEEYRYSNLNIETFLYFTGELKSVNYRDSQDNQQSAQYPVFEKINVFKYGNTYFSVPKDGSGLKVLKVISDYDSGAGILEVTPNQTQYTFLYKYTNTSNNQEYVQYKSYLGVEVLPGTDDRLENLLSYAYTVKYFTDGVSSGTNGDTRLVLFDDDNQEFYAISTQTLKDADLSLITRDTIKQLFVQSGEKFAVAKTDKFNAIAKETNDGFAYDYYMINNAGKLNAGELYSYIQTTTDAEGKTVEEEIVYTSLQFKTSYFDRDTKIVLSASPALGYRLYGWYLADYDAITGTWSTSDTQLSELINTTYTDQIVPVYFNDSIGQNGTWYYRTSNRENVDGKYIYYIDEEHTRQAVVADSVLDSVRGKYYLDGLGRWMPVYLNTENGIWYTDSTYTREYTGNTNQIKDVAHYDAVYDMSIEDQGTTYTTYYLGNSIVFANGITSYIIDEDETVTYINYYRTMKDANMTFKDNKIWIENLHSDIRIVAKFIENYQTMIFTDDSQADNMQVTAVYYDGVRTDNNDNVIADAKTTGIMMSDLNVAALDSDGKPIGYESPFNGNNYHYYNTSLLSGLDEDSVLPGFSRSETFYKIQKNNGTELVDPKPEELILTNMHFDVESDMYIVVRVHYDKKLNIHSLGLNTSNVLIPVLYPTDAFVAKNMAEKKENRIEFYYYVFKVSFNRDMAIYNAVSSIKVDDKDVDITNPTTNGGINPEYLVHVNRGKSIVGDVLSGRNTNLYAELFDFYTANGTKIFEYNFTTNKLFLTEAYRNEMLALLRSYSISDTDGLLRQDHSYDTLHQFFDELHSKYHILQSVDHIRVADYIKNIDKYNDIIPNNLQNADIKSYSDIIAIINVYLNGNKHKNLITSGTTVFVNISSIPVYTYSTSIKLINDSDGQSVQYETVQHYDGQESSKYDIDLGVRLVQSIHTRGGYLGQTYIGIAKQNAETLSMFNSMYTRRFDADANAGLPDLFADDYAIAQNTVLVVGGISGLQDSDKHNGIYTLEKGGTTYVFKGWYEQKRLTAPEGDESTPANVWSDMQFMSADPILPFESTAYADTNIIALFERVVDVKFNYDENSLSINFNTIYDDLGYELRQGATSVHGYFGITSLLKMDITPSGGYRFGSSVAIVADNEYVGDLTGQITFYQENGSSKALSQMNLVETISAELNMMKIVRLVEGDITKPKAKTLEINFETKEVQLIYIAVDGYLTTGDDGNKQVSDPEFMLFKRVNNQKLEKILETRYAGGVLNIDADPTKLIDSANRQMTIEIDPNKDQRLVMYGYFDKAFDGEFYIGYKLPENSEADVSAWYLNKYRTITASDGIKTYKIDSAGNIVDDATPKKDDEHPEGWVYDNLFRMCYYYTNNNVELTDPAIGLEDVNNHYFQGNNNNTTYLLTAKVTVKSNLAVGYATIDTLEGYDVEHQNFAEIDGANITNISKENNGNIAWTGKYYDTDPQYASLSNGTKAFQDIAASDYSPYPYQFGSDSNITLANTLEFYKKTDGTETTYYKFIGWFKLSTDGNYTMVSNSLTCSPTGGTYYAIFAKVAIIDEIKVQTIDGEELVIANSINGLVDIVSNYSIVSSSNNQSKSFAIECFGEYNFNSEKFSYAIVGTNIKITAIADQGYLVKDITPKDVAEIEPATEVSVEFTPTDAEFDVIATLTRGVTAKVKHIYYDGIDMSSVGQEFLPSTSAYLVKINGVDSYVNSEANVQTFVTGKELTFEAKNSSTLGLVGFYVNGQKITTGYTFDDANKIYRVTFKITDDITLEARYTSFVTATAAAYSVGENGKADLNSLLPLDAKLTFNNYYNNTEVESDVVNGYQDGLLSGMIVQLSSTQNATNAFLYWNYDTNTSVVSGEQVNISSQISYNQLVEELVGRGSSTTYHFYAIYQSAYVLEVYKQILSFNDQDTIYYNGDITETIDPRKIAPEFVAMLDIEITYVDIYDKVQTIILGTATEKTDIFCKKDSTVTIKANLAHSVGDRYGYNFEATGGPRPSIKTNENIEFTMSSAYNFKAQFYAQRTLTIMRQINNQPATSNVVIKAKIDALSSGVQSISDGQDHATIANIDLKENIDVFAYSNVGDQYEFAGFYVNGQYYGRSRIAGDGNAHVYIYYGDPSQSDKLKSEYYTTETNITVVGLWYARTRVTTYVALDDIALSNSIYASGNNFADKLVMTMYGNRLTGLNGDEYHDEGTAVEFTGNYNYSLQSYTTTSGYTEYILAGRNLALIASAEAGFQFVGFYVKEVTGSSDFDASYLTIANKLDPQVTNESETFFGDALASIIDGSKLVLGKRYVIVARYQTAYAITTQTTITKQESSSMTAGDYELISVVQNENYNPDDPQNDHKFTQIQSYELGVTGPNAKNNMNHSYVDSYYLPAYSTFVALDNQTTIGKYQFDGYYINGINIEDYVQRDVRVKTQNGYQNYNIIDLSNYITKSQSGYLTTNNIVIEARYYEVVDFVVRIGMNNTNDITKVNRDDLDDVKIYITYSNDHHGIDDYDICLHNREYTISQVDNYLYWNTDNNSLYYKLSLPIGTKLSVRLTGRYDNNVIVAGPYYYDGWYLYANQSVASSRTVINYTDTCEFTLSEDTDIVAQFYDTHESYTKDTQYAFRFVGEEFYNSWDDTDNSGILYASEQNTNSELATALKNALLDTGNSDEFNFVDEDIVITLDGGKTFKKISIKTDTTQTFNDPSGNNGRYLIYTIKTEDGEEHKYLFTGWYQELKGGSKNKYMFITNELGLDYAANTMPHQMENAINLCAEFVEIVDIKLNQSTANSVLLNYIDTTYGRFIENTAFYCYNTITEGTETTPKDIVDILCATVDNEMNFTIHTLYDAYYRYRYQTIQGYHNTNYDINRFLPSSIDTSTNKKEFNTRITTDDIIEQYIENLASDKYTETNTYQYVVAQTENNVLSLRAKKISNVNTTQTTNATLEGKGTASAISAQIVDKKNAANVVVAPNSNLIIDDEQSFSEDKKANVYGKITSANDNLTEVVITVTIRYPNGKIITHVLDGDHLGSFNVGNGELNFEDIEGNKTIVPMTIGTVISFSVDTRNCTNEILTEINFYRSENDDPMSSADWLVPTSESPAYDNNQYKTEFSYVVNYINRSGQDFWFNNLWFEFVFANIYPLSLTHNDTEQGAVAIVYNGSDETNKTNSLYDVTINSNDYYSANDIKFRIGAQASYTSMLDIFRGITHTSTNNLFDLYDEMIEALENGSTITPYDWSATLETIELTKLIKLSYIYESKEVSVLIVPSYSDADAIGRKYVNSLVLHFNLHIKTDIEVHYLHVANVTTFATIETYNPNTNANDLNGHITQERQFSSMLYIYDYEFYTEESLHYAVINQLEAYYNQDTIVYNGEKLKSDAFVHEGYLYSAAHLKNNASDYGVLVIDDANSTASNTLIIEAVFVHNLKVTMTIQKIDYTLGELGTDTTYLEFRVDGQTAQYYTDGNTYTTYVNLNESKNVSVLDTMGFFSFAGWEVLYNDLPIATSKNSDGTVNTLKIDYTSILYDSNFVSWLIQAFYNAKDLSVDHSQYAQYPEVLDVNHFTLRAIMQELATEVIVEYEVAGEKFNLQLDGGTIKTGIEPNVSNELVEALGGGYYAYYHYEVANKPYRFVVAYAKSNTTAQINIYAKEYTARSASAVANTSLLKEPNSLIRIQQAETYAESRYLKLVGYVDNNGSTVSSANSNILECNGKIHSEVFKLSTSNLYLVEMLRAVYKSNLSDADKATSKLTIAANGRTQNSENFSTGYSGTVSQNDFAINSVLIEEGTIVTITSNNDGILKYDDSSTAPSTRYRGLAISNNMMASDYLTEILTVAAGNKSFTYEIAKQYYFAALGIDWTAFDPEATSWDDINFDDYGIDKIPQNAYYRTLESYSNLAIPATANSFTFIASGNTSFISDNLGLFGYHSNFIATVFGADKTTTFEYANNSATNATADNVYAGNNFIVIVGSKGDLVKIDFTGHYELYDQNLAEKIYLSDELIETGNFYTYFGRKLSVEAGEGRIKYISGILPAEVQVDDNGYLFVYSDRIYYTLNNGFVARAASNNDTQQDAKQTVDPKYNNEDDKQYMTFTQQDRQIVVGLINDKVVTLSATHANKYMNMTEANGLAKALYEEYKKNNVGSYSEDYEDYNKFIDGVLNAFYNEDQDKYQNKIYIKVGSNGDITRLGNGTSTLTLKKGENVTLYAEKDDAYVFYGFIVISETTNTSVKSDSLHPGAQNMDTDYTVWTMKPLATYSSTTIGDKQYYYTNAFLQVSHNVEIIALYQPKVSIFNVVKRTYDENKKTVAADGTIAPSTSDEETIQGNIKAETLLITSDTHYLDISILTNGFSEYKGAALESSTPLGAVYFEGKLQDMPTIDSAEMQEAVALINDVLAQNDTSSDDNWEIVPGFTAGFITKNHFFTKKYSTQDEELQFKQNTNSISALRIYWRDGATSDATIAVYFNPIYYTFNLTLAEFETAQTSSSSGAVTSPNSYIAYSDEVRATENWKNPTAVQKFSEIPADILKKIELNITDDNMTVGEYFKISETDPYIYTWYDIQNKPLSYPIKVSVNMIVIPDRQNSAQEMGTIKLAGGNNVDLKTQLGVADSTVNYRDYQQIYFNSKITGIYDYLLQSTPRYGATVYGFRKDMFSISINDKEINSGDLSISGYQLVEDATSHSYRYVFKNVGLGSDFAVADILFEFDELSTNPSIQIKFKVFADANSGLPAIGIRETSKGYGAITSNSEALSSVVQFNRIGTERDNGITYQDGDEQKSTDYSLYVFRSSPMGGNGAIAIADGYNNAIQGNLFANAFGSDEEGNFVLDSTAYPVLQVNVMAAFQRQSKLAEATITVEFGESEGDKATIDFTKPNEITSNSAKGMSAFTGRPANQKTNYNLYEDSVDKYLQYIYKDYGKYGYDGDNFNYNKLMRNDEHKALYRNFVDTYDIYVVKNINTYVKALEQAALNSFNNKSQIAVLIAELLSFNPAANVQIPEYLDHIKLMSGDDYNVHTQIGKRKAAYVEQMPQSGSIFDCINIDKQEYITVLSSCGYSNLAYRLEHSDDLTFNRLNIYRNFKNSIDQNYFGTAISYNDGIVVCAKLTEHMMMHRVEYDWFGGVWDEPENGYIFLDHTTMDWGSYSNSESNGLGYSNHFDNDYVNEVRTLTNMKTVTNWQKVVNWCTGITNRGAKYAGTYSIVAHAGVIPSAMDYTNATKITKFSCNTTVQTYKTSSLADVADDRLRTANIDQVHTSIGTILLQLVAGAAMIIVGIASVMSGGALSFLFGAALVVVGTMTVAISVNDLIDAHNGKAYADNTLFGFIDQLDFSPNAN